MGGIAASAAALPAVSNTYSTDALPDAPVPQAATPVTPAPQTTAPQTKTDAQESEHQEAQKEVKEEEKQRMLGVVPNFNTVIGGHAVPLSPSEKWNLAFHSAVDPFVFVSAGLVAGLGEAQDAHQGWWGPSGYFKRWGAAYADDFDGDMLGNALFPILFHQDARYYRKGSGPAPGQALEPGHNAGEYKLRHRMLYAIATTVICKGDNGKWEPSYSNVLGNLAAGGISNLYYPAYERGAVLTIENGLTVTAEGAVGSILVEFWPDIAKRVFHKNMQTGYAPTDAPAAAN